MAGVIPAGYKQLSQKIFKTVDVTKSIITGDNGARVCKEYAFKGIGSRAISLHMTL